MSWLPRPRGLRIASQDLRRRTPCPHPLADRLPLWARQADGLPRRLGGLPPRFDAESQRRAVSVGRIPHEDDGLGARYNNPYRLTRYAKRVITTWVIVVVAVLGLTEATHGWFAVPAGLALVGYAGYRVRSKRRGLPAGRPAAPALRFNPPPGWPVPGAGWTPPPGWQAQPVLASAAAGLAVLGPGRPGAGRRAEHQVHPPGRQDRRRGQGRRPVPPVRLHHGTAL
jgi:hypothetical protein